MAKKEAKVVITGSGYGSMKDHSRLEGHLKYETHRVPEKMGEIL